MMQDNDNEAWLEATGHTRSVEQWRHELWSVWDRGGEHGWTAFYVAKCDRCHYSTVHAPTAREAVRKLTARAQESIEAAKAELQRLERLAEEAAHVAEAEIAPQERGQ